MTSKQSKIVIAGAGGHGKVVADIILELGEHIIVGATDPAPTAPAARASGLKILGTDDILARLRSEGVTCAAVGLGSIKNTAPRRALAEKLKRLGFSLPALAHPKAVVARSASLGEGCQVMAGCVINAGTRLGEHCVINTAAVVEHDCEIGPGAFVGPGAVIGGGAAIEVGAFVGLGAMILQGVRIGANAVIGAGAVVLKDVPAKRTAFGVPAAVQD